MTFKMHRRTDPACRRHRVPRWWFDRWWFDRNRGYSCQVCMKGAEG